MSFSQGAIGRWIVVVGVMVLQGCGGGGSSSSSAAAGSTGSGASSTASQTAQIDFLGKDMQKLVVTRTGIYGLQTSGNTDEVIKWQSVPGSTGWLSYGLPTRLSTFTPKDLVNDSGISVHWAGSRMPDYKRVYSYLNATADDNIGIAKIVPGGASGRQWMISGGGQVFIKASGGGLGSDARSTFVPAGSANIGVSGESSAAVADDLTLYASAGSRLQEIKTSGPGRSWNFPNRINAVLFKFGTLWVGAGTTVYKQSASGSFASFVEVPTALGLTLEMPIFCISNQDMFTADGMRYRSISTGTAGTGHSFLESSGAAFNANVSVVRAGLLSAGLYCADDVNQTIYTLAIPMGNPQMQLTKIIPL